MTLRQRINHEPGGQPSGDNDSAATSALPEVRNAADRLLAAGDEAIRRALAGGNSLAFLQASRQQGGQ